MNELCEWIVRTVCSVHELWFSLSDEDQIITAHGKRVVLFSLEKLCKMLCERGFQVLPISSESYTFGPHRFLSVFLCVHRFEGKRALRFEVLCQGNNNWGLPYSIDAIPIDPAQWIRANVTIEESHAGFLESNDMDSSNPMFNFGTSDVVNQFQQYLATPSNGRG